VAHGDLPLRRNGARQQQIRDVRAGDQQYESNRRDQNQQGSAHVAHNLFLQRHDD